MQSVFGRALQQANMTAGMDSSGQYTFFAPSNAAFEAALNSGNLTCTQNFVLTTPCTGVNALLASQNLATLMLDHGAPDECIA